MGLFGKKIMANYWVTHYEIAAIVLMFAIVILFCTGSRIHTKASKAFVGILVVAICAAVFDQLSIFGLSHTDKISVGFNYFFVIMYNMFMITVIFLYAFYLLRLTKTHFKYKWSGILVLTVPVVIEYLIIISAPVNKYLFFIDEAGIYHRGPGMTQLFVLCGIYITFIACLCLFKSKYLNHLQVAAVWCYTLSAVACIVLQIIFPKYLLNSFATAISIMFVYVSMQGDFVDSDKILGTFSLEAFTKKVDASIENGKEFNLIYIKLGGMDSLCAILGYEATNEIMRQIAEFLMRLIPNHLVFHINSMCFACYVEGNESEAFDYAVRIQDRFIQRFRTTNALNDVDIPFKIVVLGMPKHAKDSETASSIANMLLDEPTYRDEKHITIVDEKLAGQYKRYCQVELAIERAIRNGSFDVYFQPIFDMEENRVFSAEALIRLHDEEFGDIFPGEFIPVAERNGSINQITEFVVHRVCHFINEQDIQSLGLDSIEINLSKAEYTQNKTAEKLVSIIKSYDVSPEQIKFEVDEGADISEASKPGANFDVLIKNGVGITLDGFGKGYSNATELISMPVDLVKIDRTLIWMAMEDSDAMFVLKSLVSILHNLNRAIVFAGIENEMHMDIVRELDIRYVQGYYYSRPVEASKFLEYVRDVNQYGMDPHTNM